MKFGLTAFVVCLLEVVSVIGIDAASTCRLNEVTCCVGGFVFHIKHKAIFDMCRSLPFFILFAIMIDLLASPLVAADPTMFNFDELKADDVVGNRIGIYSSNTYQKQGVALSTALCRGQPLVGKQIIVRQTYAGFEVIGGHGQPAISPPNFVIPVGGAPQGCVLMKFSAPVVRVRVTTDRYRDETRDMVRLYALQPEQALQRFSILAVTEGADDALTEPDNQLEVQAANPFQYALFQCTTGREGFDDLEIEWAPEENAVKTEK